MKNNISLKGPSILTNKKPQKLVILFHGYGDNADNFISVVQGLHDPESSINYFAPNAPSSVPQYPLGYQWFELYPNGINFNEIVILNKKTGKPYITIIGQTKETLSKKFKKKKLKISLSLSDEKNYAVAFVTISI